MEQHIIREGEKIMNENEFHITTAEEEKIHFDEIEEEIKRDIKDTEDNIEYRKEAIKAQKKYMRDSHGDMDDEEFLQNMNNVNNDTLFVDQSSKRVNLLTRQVEAPYFGKLSFMYDDGDTVPIYVGTNGYWSMEEDNQKIYDWRAPISSMYYDYEKGAAKYKGLDEEFSGTILEKKQFDIAKGRFHNVLDTDEQINDMILLNALEKNSGTKMKTVVATIQKEQNKIIRNTSAYNLIVDGRAGSGKTVVAMHRLAWLMYNNRKTIHADNVMILSPNGIFGDYISGVLPEIGEDNVPEKEFDSLMEEILFVDCEYETKLEQANAIIDIGDTDNARIKNIIRKSSIDFYKAFNSYLEKYISEIRFKDFHFEKITYTKEEIERMFYGRFSKFPVYERFEKLAYFIAERVLDSRALNGADSLDACSDFDSHLEALNESEFRKLEEDEQKKHKSLETQISKSMIYQYAERNLIDLYQSFLLTLEAKYPGISNFRNEYGKVCYEDILAVFYLQVYFYGCNSYDNIKHLVIDEMQDYNIFQYGVLDRIFKCKKTILGDKFQVLFYDERETVVDVLKTVFDTNEGKNQCQFFELQTTYRSTKEITDFCNGILEKYDIGGENATALDRHGKEPQTLEVNSMEEAVSFIAEKLDYGDMDEYDNVAVLCDDERGAFEVYKELSKYDNVTYLTNQSTVYNGGVVVLPKFLAKGMEFDAVFVINESDPMKNMISRHAYYISCTRALHELYVLNINL